MWIVLALVVGLVAGALAARYWFEAEASKQYSSLQQRMQEEQEHGAHRLQEAQAQADALAGKLAIEESIRQGLEKSLQDAQTELGKAHDRLAFFDQLLPPGPKGAVSVRGLEVQQMGPTLQYQVLLMRNAQANTIFKGALQFTAAGTQNGKPVKALMLKAATVTGGSGVSPGATDHATAGDVLAISFDEFQRASGLLAVPDGFVPHSITVSVLEGKHVLVSRTVELAAAD